MPLLGKGAFTAWHDIAKGRRADYDRWHSHEHMLERVGIPGFLRGRRYVAIGGGPRYHVVYEVADVGVLASPAYLERLNNPTPWTCEIMPAVRNMNRTLCRVEASFGCGIGHAAFTVRLSPQTGRGEELARWLQAELEQLAGSPGFAGAHSLRADETATSVPTREKQLRRRSDEMADWVLLIEGYDIAAVRRLPGTALSPQALEGHGAQPGAIPDFYQLVHVVTREDLSVVAARG